MRKRALGKGLEALIPTEADRVLQEGYRMIPVEAVKPNPHQPRAKIEESDIKDLIASIKEKGIIRIINLNSHPFHYYWNCLIVFNGYRYCVCTLKA